MVFIVNWTLETEPKPMNICIPLVSAIPLETAAYPKVGLGFMYHFLLSFHFLSFPFNPPFITISPSIFSNYFDSPSLLSSFQ